MQTAGKGLSAGQLTMMALGTVLGGSFFLGSAIAIRAAGPGVLISYLVGGALVYIVLSALSEMTVADPDPGSFRTYAERVFGKGVGFTVGWVYWTGLVIAMSSEATAVSLLLRGWFPRLPVVIVGALIIVGVSLLNLLGAQRVSKFESSLAAVKVMAIIGFIVLGICLIAGLLPNLPGVGTGALGTEPLLPAGIGGIAGSMLIVMLSYSGFEVIGLAASEARDPHRTVPRAITFSVFALVGLYLLSMAVLLPLVSTENVSQEVSPFVTALTQAGMGWAGNVMRIVLVTAILATMLAAMFGLGRMIRSLAEKGQAPGWLKDQSDTPRRGILFTGAAMLAALALGELLPQEVYVFLVSAGGFAILFTYGMIVATHYKYRKTKGCPDKGKCRLPGYPFTSWAAFLLLLAIICSMPLVPGQGSGLVAGLILVVLVAGMYWLMRSRLQTANPRRRAVMPFYRTIPRPEAGMEAAEELSVPQKDNQSEKE